MGNKKVTTPYMLYSGTNINTTTYTDPITTSTLDNIGIQLNYNSASSGTSYNIYLEASIDSTNYSSLTLDSLPTITGVTSGSILFNINQVPFQKVRVNLTKVSGSLNSATVYWMGRDLN